MTLAPRITSRYKYLHSYRVYVPGDVHFEPRECESSFLTLLRNTADLSFASADLVRRGRESGFRYETEIYRAAIVAGLSLSAHARVLVIGGSGGVIARYLGERGVSVTALESSAIEGVCVAERCRDLQNVTVYVDSHSSSFFQEEFSAAFDAVICIDPRVCKASSEGGQQDVGVVPRERLLDPIRALAESAHNLLKPTGTFVFAFGNLPVTLAGHIIVPDRSSVRGTLAPPLATVEGFRQAGFRFVEPLLAYPHHAAPSLLVHPELAARRDTDWCLAALDTLDASVSAIPPVLSALKQLASDREPLKNIDAMAPGVVLLAHKHRVHSVLWGGSGARRFFLTRLDGKGLRGGSQPRDVETTVLPFSDSDIATWFEREERSRLVSLVSPSVEEQNIRRELERALHRERDLYVALAQEESKLKARFDATELRASTLERELYSTREEYFNECEKSRALAKDHKIDKERIQKLESELEGIREQHRALFKEMRRFKGAAEESFVLIQKLQTKLAEAEVGVERAARANTQLSARDRRITSELVSLRSRYQVLEKLSNAMALRASRLEGELREIKLGSIRLPGLKRLRALFN